MSEVIGWIIFVVDLFCIFCLFSCVSKCSIWGLGMLFVVIRYGLNDFVEG